LKKTGVYFILTCLLGFTNALFSQPSSFRHTQGITKNPTVFLKNKDLFGTRGFIENKGQFRDINGQAVLFAFENGSERIYFTSKGLIHAFVEYFPFTESQMERIERGKKVKEREPEVHYIYMNWAHAKQTIEIEKSEKQGHYLTYGGPEYNSYPYKKIVYKNIYDNIDIEYTIPEDREFGIKYNVILHPGARVEELKMIYSGEMSKIRLKKEGDLVIKNKWEDITEHAPKSFYLNGSPIKSNFLQNEDTVSFELSGKYDRDKTIIIDPWLTTLTTITSNNSAYDVDYDDFGNLFVYGGLQSACKIAKFNSVGSLLWTFSGIVGSWNASGISNFVVMKSSGKCYTGQGVAIGGATIIRLDANGNYDNLTSPAVSSWNEVWDMAYHCSTGNVYGMGGSTASNQSAGILNPTTGSISPIAFFTVTSTNNVGYDVVSHAIDDAGEFFWNYASGFTPNISNKIARINSAFTSSVWIAPSGFTTLQEYANKGTYQPAASSSNGFNCLAVNANYLYYYDGYNLAAYNKTTGASVATLSILGLTARKQGGIAVDDCDNLYLGGDATVLCYNFNGTSFSALPNITLGTSGTYQSVYDIQINKLNKLLYVSGSGFAGVYLPINSLACCTSSLVCAFSPPALTANSTSITCASLGSATINPLGGPGPYSYTWIPSGQTGTVANGLNPGTHSVVVYDAGCNQTFTATTLLTPVVPLTGSVTSALFCNGVNSGSAAVLNLAGGSGTQNYLWTNGTVTASTATVAVLGQGTWTVTITDAVTSCVLSQSFQLTWPPAQTLTLSQSSPTSCAGSSVSLLSNTGGGTPGYTYSWTAGPASPIYQVTEQTGGTYVYTLTVKDAYNCAISKTISVNYTGTPTLSINSVSICPQQVGTLTVSGANTYLWNNTTAGNTFTANPLTTTIYTVTGSAAICSSTGTAAIVLKSIPSPTLSSNTPFCSGQTLQLYGSGGTSFLWSGPANFTSLVQNPVITAAPAANAGVYSATVTGANSCTASVSHIVNVNLPPAITASGSTVCVTQTINLSSTSSYTGCTFYWSGPNSFTSSLQNTSIANPSVNSSGNYQLVVTDQNGCISSSVVQVTVTAMPIVSFTSNSPLCALKTLSLDAGATTGALGYNWAGPNSFSSLLQNPFISPVTIAASGIYTLVVSAGPCVTSTVGAVTVYPLPTLGIVGTNTVCETKSLNLAVLASNNVISYNWNGPAGFTDSTQSIIRYPSLPSFSGTYQATVTDTNTCSNSATLAVNILLKPLLVAPDVTVCLNEPVNLHASGATSYYWTGPGFYVAGGANPLIPSANNSAPAIYTVMGTAANSCTSIATLNLLTWPLPLPAMSVLPGTSLCLNDQVNFSGAGGVAYEWRGPNLLYFEGKELSLQMSGFITGGTYTLTAIDSLGCRASVDTLLVLNNLPTGSLQKSNSESCVPYTSDFYFSANGASSVNSSWQINTSVFSGSSFSYCFKTEGIHLIKGYLYDASTSCSNTVEFSVIAHPKPEADFHFAPDNPVENMEVVFINDSKGEELRHFNWFFIDNKGFSSASKNTSYLFSEQGVYPVAMIVRNIWGCRDSVIKTIQVDADFVIYIPDAFTPNEDTKNEVFLPVTRAVKLYRFSVFDRWGALIFQTYNPDTGWDGTFKGEACKSDVYAWLISITSNDGRHKELKGHVTLYR